MENKTFNNEEIYNNFLIHFPEYKGIEGLKDAFLLDKVEGYKGIFLGLLGRKGIIDTEAIIESGVLEADEVSNSLLKYDLDLRQKKEILKLNKTFRR